MANAIRSAKSASDWGSGELLAYNITISPLFPEEFFRRHGADPSLDHLDPAILNAAPGEDDLSDTAADYLGYLDLVTKSTQESVIDNFAARTLKLLGFNDSERNALVMTNYTIPFTTCGDSNRVAQLNVCILHRLSLVLLVLVKNKTIFNEPGPEAQVVATAIAAFQFNNKKRGERGLPLLGSMSIPCITMAGTRPTFYLVPVTQELSNAVILGQYPATQTQILKCVTVGDHARHTREGMENTDYRKLAFKRLLAFKILANSHWEQISNGL